MEGAIRRELRTPSTFPGSSSIGKGLSIKRMNPKPYIVCAAFLAASLVTGYAADQRVEKNQLPTAVQRAIDTSAVGSGPVKEITKKTVDGKVVYDVEFEKDDAINPRLRIAEDGSVLSGKRTESMAQSTSKAMDRATTSAANTVDRTGAAISGAAASTADAANRTANAANREMASARREMKVDTESMMKLEQLPASVRSTIQKEAAGREIVDIDEETHEGRKVYEVEFAQSGLNAQIHVSEDGTVLKSDNMNRDKSKGWFAGTQLKDTPSAVQATIKREVGDMRIADIDKERRTGRVVYEVEVDDPAKGKWQLHIAEDGSVVKDDRRVAE